MTFRIFIPGTPAPQGSKRHVGKGIMVESSKRVAPWRDLIVTMCLDKLLTFDYSGSAAFVGPVDVELQFHFLRPASHYRTGKHSDELRDAAPAHPRTGGDIDKLCRAVCDALGRKHGAGVIADDADVVYLRATKSYTRHPGCLISVSKADVP